MSHCFADLTAQSDNLVETNSLILNNDPVWHCHADAELIHALDVLIYQMLSVVLSWIMVYPSCAKVNLSSYWFMILFVNALPFF